MARKLRVELDLENRRALRNAKRSTDSMRKIKTEGGKAGKEIAGGMGLASQATAGFGRQLVGLGASIVSLSAVNTVIRGIIQSYNEAIRVRDQFAQGAVGANRSVAGAAAQFGVSENAMRQLVTKIGISGGAGTQDVAGISGMLTAASSAGLIGDITKTKGGGLAIGQQDFAIATRLTQFTQRTGAFGQESDLAKLIKKGLGGAGPTEENVGGVMGQLRAAFVGSELSNWGQFLTGAISGTASLLEQGVGFDTAMSTFGGLAKMSKSGQSAGEVFRMIGDRYFTATDPQMVRIIDKQYGPGAYYRMKKENPDQLFKAILQVLLSGEGAERTKLMKRLKIEPTQVGFLAKMKGSQVEAAAISKGMAGAGSMLGELGEWRRGPRARLQAAALAADSRKMAEGERSIETTALTQLADTEAELLSKREPGKQWIQEFLNFKSDERNYALKRRLQEYYEANNLPMADVSTTFFDISGDDLIMRPDMNALAKTRAITPEMQARLRGAFDAILSGAGQSTARVTIMANQVYANTPTAEGDNKITRTEGE